MTYVQSGDFPFDFDNTANATAALQTALDNGVDAVYPYLGGALEAGRASGERRPASSR